jgi:hypothetical protein
MTVAKLTVTIRYTDTEKRLVSAEVAVLGPNDGIAQTALNLAEKVAHDLTDQFIGRSRKPTPSNAPITQNPTDD